MAGADRAEMSAVEAALADDSAELAATPGCGLAVWETLDGHARVRDPRLRRRSSSSPPPTASSPSPISRNCYAPPPVSAALRTDRVSGGMLNAAFTALCGLMLIGVAAWFLWELWSAVEPKPITDDFLKLLNDSFGRDWRNPFTWPWARVLWAYGFTAVGAI